MNETALDYKLREAASRDAHALAELINFAGDGLPLYLWETMAEDGESPWDVGRKRAQREEGAFSYRNALVAEVGGKVAACMIRYGIPDEPGPIDYETMPVLFVPLQELENEAPGTWYVDVLAAYPEYRGRGLGTRMLAAAEREGAQKGYRGTSLIVSDANPGARRLYERCGYVEQATRPMVKDDWENEGRTWVLLTKDLA